MRVSTLPVIPFIVLASAAALFAQAPQARPKSRGSAPNPAATQSASATQSSADNGVNAIIELVQAKMSEALILKSIKQQNKAYNLTPDDLVRLQKAGVSEKIISAMLDPSSASSAPAPSASSAPATAPAPAPPAPAPTSSAQSKGAVASAQPGSGNSVMRLQASASGCSPQTSAANTTANKPKKRGGFFSSFGRSLKASAENAVTGAEASVNCAVNTDVQNAQSRANSTVSNAVALPTQKASTATSTGSKNTAKKK